MSGCVHKYAVLYAVDGSSRSREWLDVSLDSLDRFLNRNIDVFVASDVRFDRNGCKWIDARRYIKKYGLDRIRSVKKLGMTPSPMQMFRICAHEIDELKGANKLLYLDIDTEIISGEINRVFEIDVNSDVAGLYENSQHGNDSTRIMLGSRELLNEMDGRTVKRLKNGGYFNSGVMLMNLDEMRERLKGWGGKISRVVDIAVRHHRIVVDQDIINVEWTADPLPKRFNVIRGVVNDCNDPVILHYAGTEKYKMSEYPPRWDSWPIVD